MFSNIYRWYYDNIVIVNNEKYLGDYDSFLFVKKVVNDQIEIPNEFVIVKGKKQFISLDFVCDYIRNNNLTYKQLHEMICDNSELDIDDIKGYPWVSFFAKLDRKQVEFISTIASKENANEIFKILEDLNRKISNNEPIEYIKLLLNIFDSEMKVASKKGKGYDVSKTIEFGEQFSILFENDFKLNQRVINEFYFALKVFSIARKGEIDKYIDENINGIAGLLIILKNINLKPNSKTYDGKACFSKITPEYVYNWIEKNDYFKKEKIDEFLKFIKELNANQAKYYLGKEIYDYIIEKLEEVYSEFFDVINKEKDFDLTYYKNCYDYELLLYVLKNKGIIDDNGNVITNDVGSKKDIDDSDKDEKDSPLTLEKTDEPVKKTDKLSAQDIKSKFESAFIKYAKEQGKAMTTTLANEFLVLFVEKFSDEEISNPEFISLLKTGTKCDSKLIELVVNIKLFSSLQGILQNTNIKYTPDEILNILRLANDYNVNLVGLDPKVLDSYFEKNGYYEKEKLESLYSFFYQLIFKSDKYEYKDELISYFTDKYNIYDNFSKIQSGEYDIEHKIKNSSEDNDKKNDDNDKNNGGGMVSGTDSESQTDVNEDGPIIQKIEQDEGTEFEILEHSLPRKDKKKKDVFKTIMCGIGAISCAVLTAIDGKDLLSSVVECSKSFSSLISRNPILNEIKTKLGNNNFVPYFSEIGLKFKDLLQPRQSKVYARVI